MNAGALAAWEENVGFFPPAWRFAGVNEGDSTFSAFFDLNMPVLLAMAQVEGVVVFAGICRRCRFPTEELRLWSARDNTAS